jgi:hypothetical protein
MFQGSQLDLRDQQSFCQLIFRIPRTHTDLALNVILILQHYTNQYSGKTLTELIALCLRWQIPHSA